MSYNKVDNLYFNTQKELSWIKNIKNHTACTYTPEQLKVREWKKQLNIYFNNSILDRRTTTLSRNLYEPKKSIRVNLNINSLLNINMENVQEWKKNILFEVHEFLSKNVLIKSKIISVQFIGSLGSFEPIEYSDFDCIIILPNKKEIKDNLYFEIKKIIFRLRFYSYIFDPNQHHDLFILTENELINGIKPFYPLMLLKEKWGYGRDYFMTQENNLTPSNQINFITNNQFFRKLHSENYKNISFYNYKYILSSAFMIPVYYLNFDNHFYSKSESISFVIKQHIAIKNDFKLISELRLKWPKIKNELLRSLTLKFGFNYFSYYSVLKFYRRLEFYLPRKEFINFARSNDIELIIAKSKSISDYLLKKLINQMDR